MTGPVARLSADEATQYWDQRPRGHRLSAWASPQSDVVDADALAARLAAVEARFATDDPPLPPFWGGYVVGVDDPGAVAGSQGSAARPCALPTGRRRRHVDPRATRTVNPAAVVALIFTGGFAIGDWSSRARDDKRLEYVCKPATLTALIVVAITLDPASGASDRRVWFVAALVFSLLGDVLLMLPRDAFVAGLAAFLVAHVCYVVGFWTDPPAAIAMVIASIVVVLAVAPIARTVLRALASEPALRPPVAIYMVVIATMVASAIASGNVVAAVGAVLFAASDSLIAWDRFVRPVARAEVTIMVTYHVGQILLVLSLLV